MRNSILSIVLTVLLVGSGTLLFVAKRSNNRLSKSLAASRLSVDSLTSSKEASGNKIRSLSMLTDSLSKKDSGLERLLNRAKGIIAAREKDAVRLVKSLADASEKNTELTSKQKELDKQVDELKTTNARLGEENKNLNMKVANLAETNTKLTTDLAAARLLEKDNVCIEALSRTGKLNVRGKKVGSFVAMMALPEDVKAPSFRIFDPNGNQLPDQAGSFTFQTSTENSAAGKRKLEVTCRLSKKIGPGMYRIEILSEKKHLGNVLMNLR